MKSRDKRRPESNKAVSVYEYWKQEKRIIFNLLMDKYREPTTPEIVWRELKKWEKNHPEPFVWNPSSSGQKFEMWLKARSKQIEKLKERYF